MFFRCGRNCFNCPICTAPLAVSSLDTETNGAAGPWILACDFCNWTTLDVNIRFEKPTSLHSQLAKLRNKPPSSIFTSDSSTPENSALLPSSDPSSQYAALKGFYQTSLGRSNSSNPLASPTADSAFNSPSSLARIMSLYTGLGSYGRKAGAKAASMRDAADLSEGQRLIDPAAELVTIARTHAAGWLGTTTATQRSAQVAAPSLRFVDELRPVPTLLRTKRSRRCRACRHLLVKPEAKVQSTRYKIRTVATGAVPSMTVKPLAGGGGGGGGVGGGGSTIDLEALAPSTPLQFLLTVKNAMFETIKVSLATPSVTPGRWGSRVTVLCPEFEVGKNADAWDEALEDGGGRRVSRPARTREGEVRVAEAGKVWEKGRNWTSVVVEVVGARIGALESELEEDEDVLEIPVFVRIEYEGEVAGEDAVAADSESKKEKRELAYWCVLGVGRLARPTVLPL